MSLVGEEGLGEQIKYEYKPMDPQTSWRQLGPEPAVIELGLKAKQAVKFPLERDGCRYVMSN